MSVSFGSASLYPNNGISYESIHLSNVPPALPSKYSDDFIDSYIFPDDAAKLTLPQRADRKEFLRRIKPAELGAWLESSKNLPSLDHSELDALTTGRWDHPIFSFLRLEDYALKAFISGHVDKWLLSEILIYSQLRDGKSEVHHGHSVPGVALLQESLADA